MKAYTLSSNTQTLLHTHTHQEIQHQVFINITRPHAMYSELSSPQTSSHLVFQMTFLLCGLWTVLQLYIACLLQTCENGLSHIFIVTKSSSKCPHVRCTVAEHGQESNTGGTPPGSVLEHLLSAWS